MEKWIDVGTITEIKVDEFKTVDFDHEPIAVFNLENSYYAIQDNCPHQHMPLADGEVIGCVITCPFHGARFDIKTGAVLSPPACENLVTYPTRVVNGIVQVQVKDHF